MKLKTILVALLLLATTGCLSRLEDFYDPRNVECHRVWRKFEPYEKFNGVYSDWPNPDSWRVTQLTVDTATIPVVALGGAVLLCVMVSVSLH